MQPKIKINKNELSVPPPPSLQQSLLELKLQFPQLFSDLGAKATEISLLSHTLAPQLKSWHLTCNWERLI